MSIYYIYCVKNNLNGKVYIVVFPKAQSQKCYNARWTPERRMQQAQRIQKLNEEKEIA